MEKIDETLKKFCKEKLPKYFLKKILKKNLKLFWGNMKQVSKTYSIHKTFKEI